MSEIKQRFANNKQTAIFCGVSSMTLWRWKNDPELGFPKASNVNGRDLNDIAAVEDWLRAKAVGRVKNAAGGK